MIVQKVIISPDLARGKNWERRKKISSVPLLAAARVPKSEHPNQQDNLVICSLT